MIEDMSHQENENHLWKNYLNYLNNEKEWMKETSMNMPFPTRTYSAYSEKEFMEKLEKDIKFREKWGNL